ncbi:MAG TPA: PDZ domain-containing protein [Humisphaera sp.]
MPTKPRTTALLALAIATALPAFALAQADKPAQKPDAPAQPAQPEQPRRPRNPNRPNAGAGANANRLAPDALYERVAPSLVAVKYTWDFELRRQELIGAGVVVSDDGLVACPLTTFSPIIPDVQMKDFKIILAREGGEPDEVDAEFVGRDERVNLAYVRAKKPDEKKADDKKDGDKKDAEKKADEKKPEPRKWVPVKFEDVPLKVGEPLWSVGVLPAAAGYRAYLQEARVAAKLRGDSPQVLVAGGLAGVGAPVFNARGQAVGMVPVQNGQLPFINDSQRAIQALSNPPLIFIPSGDFLPELTEVPAAGKPLEVPWMGVVQMAGVTKDVAEAYGLGNDPGVQIGDVIADGPGAKAGLKQGDIIVRIDGKPLERGDEPDDLPAILRRLTVRKKVGTVLTLGVKRKPDEPPVDVKVTLGAMPKQANQARRAYFEDLGFGVRELVFNDRYARRIPADAGGVLVSVTKPQGAAQTGGLQGNGTPQSDVIVSLSGQPVKDLAGFEQAYKDLRKAKPKEAVVLVVRREGKEETVRVEPPQ